MIKIRFMSGADRWIPLAVFLAALTVRIAGLARHGQEEVVFGIDMAIKHGEVARNLYERGIFLLDETHMADMVRASFTEKGVQRLVDDVASVPVDQSNARVKPYLGRMPGYPILLTATWKLFGRMRYHYAQTFTVILDSLGAVLIFLIAKRLFGLTAGVLAGVLYCFWPPLVILSYSPGHDAPAASLNVLALYFSLKALERWSAGLWLASGLALMIGTMFRQEPLLLPFAWWLPLGFAMGWKKSTLASGLMFAVVLSGNLAWAYRNLKATGKFTFLVPVYAGALLIGYGDTPNPWGIPGTDAEFVKWANGLNHTNYSMFSEEFNSICMAKAAEVIREDPLWYLRLAFRRGVKSLAPTFLAVYPGPYEYRKETGGGLGSYIRRHPLAALQHLGVKAIALFLWPLAILSFYFFRKNWRTLFLIAMVPIYYWAAHVPQHLEYRYMIPGFVPLFILASGPLSLLLEKIAVRAKWRLTS